MDTVIALNAAIAKADGQRKFADMLAKASGLPVTQQAVSLWVKSGKVPSDWCPWIEKLFAVTCEELRPDVAWHVLRARPAKRSRTARRLLKKIA